ncbi:hypothetical protein TRFO_24201 [Tritrichomonas foetus]|uniref:RRM domain-containing protein n=1 Tax=Tritrichomonas foetus TaxID=1144522 RepID=A0A1J4K9J7_9EUKA|nr:hypothetical protein TRFO_24201 [Tritrichomonas foetus]|eukprot:OHT07618.1 hypothetical protein TRFO_24201 [Tritrichomonas foetus]
MAKKKSGKVNHGQFITELLKIFTQKIQKMQPSNVEARPRQHAPARRVNMRPSSECIAQPRPIKNRPRSTNIEPSTNVFINYIPAEFTEGDLRELCSQYGDIVCSKIMINLETGQSKCFGFVRFATLQQAQQAIRGLNGRQIGSKRLLAKYAESREKQEKVSTMIYIKRLPTSIDGNYVAQLFSRFGHIQQMTPHILDTVDPQFWRCFIRYTTFEEAASAIASMNNQIIAACSRPIHVRYADETRLSGTFLPQFSEIQIPGPSMIDETDERQLLPSFLLQ